MQSNKSLEIFIGEEKVVLPKKTNFYELKYIILNRQKKFVKYFTYNNIKIEKKLLVLDYPTFATIIDRNNFIEYRKGQYRCKRCRKYVNLSLWKCAHTSGCRAYYLLKLKITPTIELVSGYNEEENMIKEIEQEVDELINKKTETRRQSMLK